MTLGMLALSIIGIFTLLFVVIKLDEKYNGGVWRV
ncbi:hypothetical protein vBPpSSYP_213 [Pseudomonas phage vB_PpS_SYP]|nr:hypothetical protein vBPpSSYP_213 [Pseudomonas phage vB_PpS_SYP]